MRFRSAFRRVFCLAAVVIAAGAPSGCAKKQGPAEEVVAVVDGEPVYAREFEQEISFKAASDPLYRPTPQSLEEDLRLMIDRKILIREAKKARLDEKEKFIRTIKLFWEQTLIRDLVQAKEAELARDAEVTEDEALRYYEKLSDQVTLGVVKHRDKEIVRKFFGFAPEQVPWDETIGPVSYDGLSSGHLAKAFELQEGEKRLFEEGGFHYLVYMKKREKIERPPFDELREKITEQIRAGKVRNAFSEWMEGLKKRSGTGFNRDALKKIQYRYDRTEK